MKLSLALIAAALLLAFALYVVSQRPKASFNLGTFNFNMTKGGYRGLTVEFCDGMAMQPQGKFKPVILDKDGKFVRFGYYWIPKVRWLDVRKLHIPGVTE